MENLLFYIRRILFIIKKEFLVTIKDPKSRIILVLPAMLQTFLFGYVATFNLDRVDYALLDMSHSYYATELVGRVEGSGVFRRVVTLENAEQISSFIDTGKVQTVILIPADFENKIGKGELSPIEVITDGRNTMTSGIISGYVYSIVSAYNQEIHAGKHGITLDSIVWYNPNLITRWGFLASLLPLISLVQVLMLSGLSVAREKEQGTFEQLMVTPLTPTEILIGKAIPPLCIGLLQSFLVLCIASVWFHVYPVGSILTLFFVMTIFLLSCIGIGLSISAIVKNMQQVIVYNFIILVPFILLSGMVTPVRNMPKVLQYLTLLNPTRFVIAAVRRIYVEGAGLGDVALSLIPMLLVALVTMPLAAWMFRHKLS